MIAIWGGVCSHRYQSLLRAAAAVRGVEAPHWTIDEKGGREGM